MRVQAFMSARVYVLSTLWSITEEIDMDFVIQQKSCLNFILHMFWFSISIYHYGKRFICQVHELLPSAKFKALDKHAIYWVHGRKHSAKNTHSANLLYAECYTPGTRQILRYRYLAIPLLFFLPRANSALGKALLSAREIALGKDFFAVTLVAVSCLPSIIGPLPSARAQTSCLWTTMC